LAYQRRYNAQRRDKDRAYRSANKDHINALSIARYRACKIEGKTTQQQRWCAKNPEKARMLNVRNQATRRAKMSNAPFDPRGIKKFISEIRRNKSVRCYYCDRTIPGSNVHIDHVVALSKGGAHSISNLCASCPECNLGKNSKMIKDWMRLGQQILAI